ncbi:hypothetical protein [Loigolactobacillus rennini]|uniref:AP2 domain-containing protein n=1 Tax=Loigolactobacillus rennini DSM 20253 TaxID=1423796 RepID=A0A0R2CPQ0_9LACO|nr:hypothetical protein [Loigolactobacillus rennini]KRM92882.1 hypothetical protein FC24_GL000899 [Loigolactobacillus rennini DSM 20253]
MIEKRYERVETGVYKHVYRGGVTKYVAISAWKNDPHALFEKHDTIAAARAAYRKFKLAHPVDTWHGRRRDLTNQRFGHLTALWPVKGGSNGQYTKWHCLCDCGRETEPYMKSLLNGVTTTCGASYHHEHVFKKTQEINQADIAKYGTIPGMLKQSKRKSNTTGYKGVTRSKLKSGTMRYRAYLTVAGKSYRGHRFERPEDAYAERLELEAKYLKPILKQVEQDRDKKN